MKSKKPDWRNPDDYIFDNLFMTERESYAWEFLRRNEEYRQVWDKELKAYLKKKQDSESKDSEIDSSGFGIIPDDPKILEYFAIPWLVNPDDNSPYLIFRSSSIVLSKKEAFIIGYPVEDHGKLQV
ncbi:MAG: DUF6499 domain-containing protein, partial [Desulfobacterales bacterium]